MAQDIDPSSIALTTSQAQRLSKVSSIDVAELSGRTVKEISDKLGHRIDPQLLLFRRICGTVTKTDPVTGIAYPVPYATVEVEDTDCSLLGYFPSSSPWSWFFPFSCRREVIGTTTTDVCGRFCVLHIRLNAVAWWSWLAIGARSAGATIRGPIRSSGPGSPTSCRVGSIWLNCAGRTGSPVQAAAAVAVGGRAQGCGCAPTVG